MDTLDLDVDQGILVNIQVELLLYEGCKLGFGGFLHFHPFGVELRILFVLEHLFQLRHVSQPLVRSKVLREDGAQGRVGAVHPAAGRHAISHVHDFVSLAKVAAVPVKLREGLLLDDLCVDGRHTVHLVCPHNGQVSHPDLLDVTLLEDAEGLDDRAVAVLGNECVDPPEVELADDLHMTWEHAGHHLYRPLLQSLRHNCVVRVVQALGRQIPGLIPRDPHDIHEEPHHLSYSDRWVRVVHLHSNFLRQLGPVVVGTLDEFTQQVLQGGADKEILLTKAKLFTLISCIVWVQDRRKVLCLAPVLHCVREAGGTVLVQVELLGWAGSPQPQVVGVVGVETRNGVVISHGLDDVSPDPIHTPVA
mmetsp:Transcript_24094/g.55875  ORF Transcript_24094/g.55875 Transcript_24094/m.55875 type:complete len:362 (-) Transcript_24094:781-1866(-)